MINCKPILFCCKVYHGWTTKVWHRKTDTLIIFIDFHRTVSLTSWFWNLTKKINNWANKNSLDMSRMFCHGVGNPNALFHVSGSQNHGCKHLMHIIHQSLHPRNLICHHISEPNKYHYGYGTSISSSITISGWQTDAAVLRKAATLSSHLTKTMAWMSNYIHGFLWDVVTYPGSAFNGSSAVREITKSSSTFFCY